jgi:putative tryptophan/tyrosine transport system substrate-binding protein
LGIAYFRALGEAMRRRDFVKATFVSAVTWPLAARAQQPSSPMIGYLSNGTPQSDEIPFRAPFRDGLRATGYAEGKNIGVEYRWAEFQIERLRAQADDLVRRHSR